MSELSIGHFVQASVRGDAFSSSAELHQERPPSASRLVRRLGLCAASEQRLELGRLQEGPEVTVDLHPREIAIAVLNGDPAHGEGFVVPANGDERACGVVRKVVARRSVRPRRFGKRVGERMLLCPVRIADRVVEQAQPAVVLASLEPGRSPLPRWRTSSTGSARPSPGDRRTRSSSSPRPKPPRTFETHRRRARAAFASCGE